jgi:hypothetical protein
VADGRAGLAFGLLFLFGLRRWCSVLVQLLGHRRQVGFDIVFQQALLVGAEALGLGGELHALEERVLVGEFVDHDLLEGQRLVFGAAACSTLCSIARS